MADTLKVLQIGPPEARLLLQNPAPQAGLIPMLRGAEFGLFTLQMIIPSGAPFIVEDGKGVVFFDDGDLTRLEFGFSGGPGTYHRPSLANIFARQPQVIVNAGDLTIAIGALATFAGAKGRCILVDTTGPCLSHWVDLCGDLGALEHCWIFGRPEDLTPSAKAKVAHFNVGYTFNTESD